MVIGTGNPKIPFFACPINRPISAKEMVNWLNVGTQILGRGPLVRTFSQKRWAEGSTRFPVLGLLCIVHIIFRAKDARQISASYLEISAPEAVRGEGNSSCPNLEPKIRSSGLICPNLRPIYQKKQEISGSKREEWSDCRATSEQSARRVSTGTDVHGKNRFSSDILLLKSVNCVLLFEIIAEPTRRTILSLLVSSQQSVGEIGRQLRMPQPTVSKHLHVLREAGFVESTVDAQRRLYRLKPEPLQEVDAWLAPFRRFWSAHVDALERHLDHMDQSTPTKRKTRRRRRGPNRERDKGETK